MRDAAEILNEKGVRGEDYGWEDFRDMEKAIRQAQIEAIEECAEVSGAELQINDMHVAAAMVKNKILQLKNQVR